MIQNPLFYHQNYDYDNNNYYNNSSRAKVNRVNELEELLQNEKNKNENIEINLNRKEKQIKTLQSQLNETNKNLNKIKDENNRLKINLTQKEKELNKRENKINMDSLKIKELENKLKVILDDNQIKDNKVNIIDKYHKLKADNEKLNNIYLKEKNENDKLKQYLRQKDNELTIKENLIKEQIKKIQDLENKLKEIFKDNRGFDKEENIVDNYLKLKYENQKLKNELRMTRYNSTEMKEAYKEINNELERKNIEITKLKKDIINIMNQKNKEFEEYKKNDYNEKFINKKLEEFYDVIINIRSIKSLIKDEGWPIKWNQKRKELVLKLLNKELLKVGVLGNGNMGKSFLLSRLFNDHSIPSGYSVITEGLSLKFNENIGYTLLDSAGLQTPLLRDDENLNNDEDNNNNINKSLYKDKTQTENFIQNLIIYLSDMLLIVVGKLTFNEQQLINKIKKLFNEYNTKKDKKIYIIHNLVNFQEESQVEEHIKNTLFKSASFNLKYIKYFKTYLDGDNSFNGRQYLVVNDENNGLQTFHLIMAREGSPAGNHYNKFTYKLLNEQFSNFHERKPLSIIDEVKNRFAEWSSDLLEKKIKPENIDIVTGNNKEEKIIFKKTDENTEIIPKACISDELGMNIYRSNGFEPSYFYYIENNEYLVVVLEVPGDVKIDSKYADSELYEVVVIGTKEDWVTSKNPIYNNTKTGKFEIHIPYKNYIKIADEKPVTDQESFEKGILQFKFQLIKKREKGTKK